MKLCPGSFCLGPPIKYDKYVVSSAHRSLMHDICIPFHNDVNAQVEGISPVVIWMPKEGYALSTLCVAWLVDSGTPKPSVLVVNLLLVAELNWI